MSVHADYHSVKLVVLIPLKTFLLVQADHLPLQNFQFG